MLLQRKNKLIITVVLLCLALFSFFVVSQSEAISSMNESVIESLDNKKMTVAKLATTSTAASTAITLIPGDAGQPLAENLADISDYLLIVIASIWLQKFLITVTAIISFKFLFPIAIFSLIIYLFVKREVWLSLALKLSLFAILIFTIIPASVFLSESIEKNYEASISQTIEKAEKNNIQVEKSATKNKDKGFWDGIKSKVKSSSKKVVTQFERSLSNMIDAVAVLLVTSCIIPILVLYSFIKIINVIFGLSISTRKADYTFIKNGINKLGNKKRVAE